MTALKKWSQAEVIFSTTSTTKICIIDGADPINKLISASDFFNDVELNFVLTKEAVEAVLTGNITSHTHNYLSSINKSMVENVLIGSISSHTHDVTSITNAVSTTDLSSHAENNTHLTEEQLLFLNTLISNNGGLTQEQIDILNLFTINLNNDLELSSNLIVEGSITAYSIGDPNVTNYDLLEDWLNYDVSMIDWVVSAPLLYDLYTTTEGILITLDSKVSTSTQIIPGLGMWGGGTLDNDVTISWDIENLTTDIIVATDYLPFYRSGDNHYKTLVSSLPFVQEVRNILTENGIKGGGDLTSDLTLELNISGLEVYVGTVDTINDYIVVYDESTSSHKKINIGNLNTYIEEIAFDFNDIITGTIQTYILDIKAISNYNILSIILQSDSTIDDVCVKISGVNITGLSAIDVTSSISETDATANNSVLIDNQVTLITSGTDGGATLLRGKLKIQRT